MKQAHLRPIGVSKGASGALKGHCSARKMVLWFRYLRLEAKSLRVTVEEFIGNIPFPFSKPKTICVNEKNPCHIYIYTYNQIQKHTYIGKHTKAKIHKKRPIQSYKLKDKL